MSEPESPNSPRAGADNPDASAAAPPAHASGQAQDPAEGIDPYGDLPEDFPSASSGDGWDPPQHGTGGNGASPRPPRPGQPYRPAPAQAGGDQRGGDRDAGGPPPVTDAIAAYKVPSRRGPLLVIGLVTLAVVVAIVIVAMRPQALDQKPAATSSTPSASTSAKTSAPAGTASVTNSIPVTTATFSGTWTIESSTWDSSGVTVQMTLTATSGSLSYTFFGLDNSSTDEVRARGSMANGSISAGTTQHGSIRMDKARGDTTLILAGQNQRQITALLVPA